MRDLQGVGVLVTRPERQAAPLCALLESFGAEVIRLPAIDIKPAQDLGKLKRQLALLPPFHFVIFTSANAVRFGAPALAFAPDTGVAAIGPATARALQQAGLHTAIMPEAGFDSASLLRHHAFAHLGGRRLLIVTGLNGLGMLRDQLVERGGDVMVAPVYRREPLRHDAAALDALAARFAAGAVHVVTATSGELAAALLDMATPALRRELDRAHWLVPGTRVAGAVRALGARAAILQADSAADQDLVAALRRWRASVSGA